MNLRWLIAMILGLALGLAVAALTYFNDGVIRQTMFIGNFLPISVFGLVILTLLVINPLLRAISPNLPLTAAQVAIITAIGLAACGWPGSNLFRGFIPNAAVTPHLIKTRPAWQSAEVMSYVPDGSARLGLGHVQDWHGLAVKLVAAANEPDAPLHAVWQRLPGDIRTLMHAAAKSRRVDISDEPRMLAALNDIIVKTEGEPSPIHADTAMRSLASSEAATSLRAEYDHWLNESQRQAPTGADSKTYKLMSLHQAGAQLRATAVIERLNRLALVSAAPDHLMPIPAGKGLLLNGGLADPFAMDTLVQGWDVPNTSLGLGDLPWQQWWPTIRLWGGLVLTLGLSCLCLSLVVHVQWSRRELLAYPIAKFIDELAERQGSSWLPDIARNRNFWYAVIAMLVLHGLNGLHVWFPDVPFIKTQLPFEPLKVLFPKAQRVNGSYAAFAPTLCFTPAAFAFFLATNVSFSIGIALYVWMAMGTVLLAYGVPLENEPDAMGKGNLLRFGAYLASAVMILYVGRRYYLHVAASVIGLARHPDTPRYATWAARCMILLCAAAVWLGTQAGLDAWMSAVFVSLCMLIFLVMSRICAETGLFFIQTWWMPMAVLTALMGAEAIGPTTYIVLAMCSIMIVGDPRETLMPYLVNGLQMGDRTAGRSPASMSGPLAAMIVLSFIVAMTMTFYFSYNRGFNQGDPWGIRILPAMPFNRLTTMTAELASTRDLSQATAVHGLERLAHLRPSPNAYGWLLLGMGLVFVAALARLRWAWWPIHPVLFLIWGTYPSGQFHLSFLLGWLIKTTVVKTMGTRGYHALKPLMVGVIAGELLAGLIWMGVGAVYYGITGQVPERYVIFPG